ncbi:MAG: aminopeptidase [Planctomycetes bacterium]|nr:aminopeptidase [Planctomycetota bacterium]
MRDSRLDKLAKVLVEYSVGVKPGQIVRINGDPVGIPLMEAIYERCVLAGAHPFIKCSPSGAQEFFLEHASDEQLKFVSPLALKEIETIDVSIGLWAETNTKSLSRIDPKRQGVASSARKPIFKVFMDRAAKAHGEPGKLYWCGTQYPTEASAQDAERSLRQYEDFVFNAGHLDKPDPVAVWKKIHEQQERLREFMVGKKIVRFQAANGTDLTVNVSGGTWINCSGHENFPDGEVFCGPTLNAEDGGVNGVVRFSFPAVHHGREVHDIEFTFVKGRVTKATASKNQDFLLQMLNQDPGARNLGEIAIGTNYNITEYTKNTLFDEKIGGTFHAAVGAGYPESGNTNESGLHWDMVCDLRTGGTITVDGTVISRDGKFLFPGWPGNE